MAQEVIENSVDEQRNEIILLQSMYELNKEIFFPTGKAVDENSNELPTSYSLRLDLEGHLVELFVCVPRLYPIVEWPSLRVSADTELFDIFELNTHIRTWLKEQELGTAIIFQVIEEIRSSLSQFFSRRSTPCKGSLSSDDSVKTNQSNKLARYWILSHHLFSQTKRVDLIKLANEMDVKGFTTPGKPAIIVAEGRADMVLEYWHTVRTWSWKKITLMEDEEAPVTDTGFLRFQDFKEFIYDAGTSDHKKVDTSRVRKLLDGHGLADHFNNVYGIPH